MPGFILQPELKPISEQKVEHIFVTRHIAKPIPMFTFSINSVIKGSNKIERTKGGARPKNRMGLEAPTT